MESHSLVALAFDNELADRKFAFKRFNGNNQATSCPKLVNFLPVISEFTLLFAQFFPRFARKNGKLRTFVTLAFTNGMG